MARSCHKLVPLLLGAVLPAVAAPVPEPGAQQPISLDAASSDMDYKTNTVVFRSVVISQGDTRVQADHARATGLNFANSRWDLEGHVRIDAEQHGHLRSDQAIVEFRDNHLARATVTGKPAEFEQQRAGSDQIARGHADQIVYDVNEATVRLADDAWLSDGQTEVSGALLVYNIRAQQLQAAAAPGTDQRVHISIAAPRLPEAGKPDAQKRAAPGITPPGAAPPAATPPVPKPPGSGPGPQP
jgi:lipopolysaccharide transport protein LptA